MRAELSEFFSEKAKVELGEDEGRKLQALQRINEWIVKHPFITDYKGDDLFVLALLKARKFNLDRTLKSIEKMATFATTHSECLDFAGVNFRKICEILESGFVFLLKTRDAEGRKTIVVRMRSLQADKYTTDDVTRALICIPLLSLLEQETQVAGVQLIMDLSNVSLLLIEKYLLSCLFKLSGIIKYTAFRMKSIFVVGLPPFTVNLIEISKSLLSEKLRERVVLLKCMDDMRKHLDKSLSAEVIEDPEATAKAINETKRMLLVNIEKIRGCVGTAVDLEKLQRTKGDTSIGNFRRLEID